MPVCYATYCTYSLCFGGKNDLILLFLCTVSSHRRSSSAHYSSGKSYCQSDSSSASLTTPTSSITTPTSEMLGTTDSQRGEGIFSQGSGACVGRERAVSLGGTGNSAVDKALVQHLIHSERLLIVSYSKDGVVDDEGLGGRFHIVLVVCRM